VCVCVCILTFVILRANLTLSAPNRIVTCSLSDPITFATLSHKRHDFWKKKFI